MGLSIRLCHPELVEGSIERTSAVADSLWIPFWGKPKLRPSGVVIHFCRLQVLRVLSARLHEMILFCWYRQLWPASSA